MTELLTTTHVFALPHYNLRTREQKWWFSSTARIDQNLVMKQLTNSGHNDIDHFKGVSHPKFVALLSASFAQVYGLKNLDDLV